MSTSCLNYQLISATGNAVASFTLHDGSGAVVTPASITNVSSSGYTAVGTVPFSGNDSDPDSGSPMVLTVPGEYRLSTSGGLFNDSGNNVDVLMNGVNKINLNTSNTPTTTLTVTQAEIDAGGTVTFRQNMGWFATTVTLERWSTGDGWDRKNITFTDPVEAVFVTPTFANPAAPVPVYLLFTAPDSSMRNVLDNSVFSVASPGRPTPRGEHAIGYTDDPQGTDTLWTLNAPENFTPKIKRRSKDPLTGLPLYGNEFSLLWSGPLPNAAQVECDVEDITDPAGFVAVPTTNATTYAESSVGLSLLKATSEIIPQDGFEHSLRFRIRYNCAGDVSPWVESAWLAATYILPAPNAPASITVNVLRDRSDIVPDRIRLDWTWAATNPGDAVELYAIDFTGKRHLLGEETDNAAGTMTVENVTRFYQVAKPPAVQTAYRFGVLSKNRTSKSDLTLTASPVLLTSKVKDTSPPTPDEVAGTAITLSASQFPSRVATRFGTMDTLSSEQKATLATLSVYAVTAVFNAIKDVVMKGGEVSVADFGVFRAKWIPEHTARVPATGGTVLVPAARGCAFTPSIGYKLGTKRGILLTDDQAKEPAV